MIKSPCTLTRKSAWFSSSTWFQLIAVISGSFPLECLPVYHLPANYLGPIKDQKENSKSESRHGLATVLTVHFKIQSTSTQLPLSRWLRAVANTACSGGKKSFVRFSCTCASWSRFLPSAHHQSHRMFSLTPWFSSRPEWGADDLYIFGNHMWAVQIGTLEFLQIVTYVSVIRSFRRIKELIILCTSLYLFSSSTCLEAQLFISMVISHSPETSQIIEKREKPVIKSICKTSSHQDIQKSKTDISTHSPPRVLQATMVWTSND